MALSNRDRIGKGFELLAAGLGPFVNERMGAAAPDGNWIALLESRDEAKNGVKRAYDANDPAVQLRTITDEWRVYSRHLSRSQQSLASELREARNKWAHNEAFSADDTYRALDTMERLLQAVGAPAQADLIRQQRLDLRSSAVDTEMRKAAREMDPVAAVAGAGLKPWREVLQPHEDVATGNFSASEFAADLHEVAKGEGSSEYVDPAQFFRRTYVTEGLRDLLDRAVRRIGGDANASPIVNLQTNFGGGKTHSMLALWHLFGGTPVSSLPQDVQELVGDRSLPPSVRRVALVGTHLTPGAVSTKPDGTVVKTIWGELAWQLGGAEGYATVAESDAARTNPGESLKTLLTKYSPSLILIDEWVAYARQLWNRDDLPGGTFDTQFTFAQTLTEAVKAAPGCMLVISIPASHDPDRDGESGGSAIEVGGPNGQQALQRLQNVVRRVADQWRPASATESFEIVRRRLFVEADAQAIADIGAVARAFRDFYAKHQGEFPRECTDTEYEKRIRAAYPIHPELFDRLYEDWSTLERFQRTRGVLQLMSSVVHELWMAQDAGPMIMPGSVPLDTQSVLTSLTQYLPDSWKPIIDADIDGPSATSVAVDRERPLFGQRFVARRIARTIFVSGAPTLQTAHKGVDRQRIWLGVAVPGDTVGNFGSALDLLSQRSMYLYADTSRYWFNTQASVQRTATDFADRLLDRPEEVWQEIVRRLRASEARHRGGFAAVHVAPEDSADIPDEDVARLVVLHPRYDHIKVGEDSAAKDFCVQALEKRGSAPRHRRNMLVFLAPDTKRLEELMEATRHFLAWNDVAGRAEELDLSAQQTKQAQARREQADQAVTSRIGQTYVHVLIPEQPVPSQPITWTVEKADGSEPQLAVRVTDRLRRSGALTDVTSPRTIRLDLDQRLAKAWEAGHISVGTLWDYYAQYPYLTRMRDRAVLDAGIADVVSLITWREEGFALADGFDSSTGRYSGLVLPGGDAHGVAITDATLIVRPDIAEAQAVAERPAVDPGSTLVSEADDVPAPLGGEVCASCGLPTHVGPCSTEQAVAKHTRYFGAYAVDSSRYARDFTRLSQEVLQHLAAVDDVDITITVEVEARSADGFADDKIRVISENARTLKFTQSTFEVE